MRLLTKLVTLRVDNNSLTGFPSGIQASDEIKIFPNPMSDVPYDLVVPASIGTLTAVTFEPFMNTSLITSLRKRQMLSQQFSADQLHKLCPSKNSKGQDLYAGCLLGLYNKFCRNPAPISQCQDTHYQVWQSSIYKSLGAVCPAWKSGPRSKACTKAVSDFSQKVVSGLDASGRPEYQTYGPLVAQELVNTIFTSKIYAPCTGSSCSW